MIFIANKKKTASFHIYKSFFKTLLISKLFN